MGQLTNCFYSSIQMVVYIFLFTDMLLITKPIKKGGNRYAVVRPVRGHHTKKSYDMDALTYALYHLSSIQPYKIASLVLSPLEPGEIPNK